ncbi:terminase small subunit [Acinetobacter sp. FNA3]|nr:terminase small subunit [Acinetobacter pollinis]MBF7691997.1 terminase small subunit [Acinetobacter pollinis]MBF7697055.1 terminase small subunit [Acinetobacter pollinis]MBF7700446.1 terminase small subunit [Acinetobacter pollinis]
MSHLKKQKFVDEYLIDVNAAQAAIRAGYSEKIANVYSANNKKLICVMNYNKN